MEVYIGMDVHCKKTVYVIQEGSWKLIAQGSVPTSVEGFSKILDELAVPSGTKIGLETGSQSWWVSSVLSGLGMQPVVIDAREVRAKARKCRFKIFQDSLFPTSHLHNRIP